MSKEIFISYSREELTFVDSLYQDLIKEGNLSIWLDFRELVIGQEWSDDINTALSSANTVVLVVSKESMDSDPVEHEWKMAVAQKKRIIVVIFDDAPLPDELKQVIQTQVDFRGSYKVALAQLLSAINNPTYSVPRQIPESEHILPRGIRRLSMLMKWASWLIIFSGGAIFFAGLMQIPYALRYNENLFSTIFIPLVLITGITIGLSRLVSYMANKILQRRYHFWQLIGVYVLVLIVSFYGTGIGTGFSPNMDNQLISSLLMIVGVFFLLSIVGSLAIPYYIGSGDVYRWSPPKSGFSVAGLPMEKNRFVTLFYWFNPVLWPMLYYKHFWQKNKLLAIFLALGAISSGPVILVFFIPTIPIWLILFMSQRSTQRYRKQKKHQAPMISLGIRERQQLRVGVQYALQNEAVARTVRRVVNDMECLTVEIPYADYLVVLLSEFHTDFDATAIKSRAIIIPIALQRDNRFSIGMSNTGHLQALDWSSHQNVDALKLMLENPDELESRQYLPGQFPERQRKMIDALPETVQDTLSNVGRLGQVASRVTGNLAGAVIDKVQPQITLNPEETLSFDTCMRNFGLDERTLAENRAGRATTDQIVAAGMIRVMMVVAGVVMLGAGLFAGLVFEETEFWVQIILFVDFIGIVLIGVGAYQLFMMRKLRSISGGIHIREDNDRYYIKVGRHALTIPSQVARNWEANRGIYTIYLLGNIIVAVEPDDASK